MNTVAVVGLGYVGLPLAVEFGKLYPTIGFDLNAEKVAHYRRHEDPTGEVSPEQLRAAHKLTATPPHSPLPISSSSRYRHRSTPPGCRTSGLSLAPANWWAGI